MSMPQTPIPLEYLPGMLKTGGKTPPSEKDQEGRQDPALAQAAWEHQLPHVHVSN